jgi:hypothetical protein
MRLVGDETCPLPDDPVLASVARALNDGGHWGEVVDREWRGAFLTDEARWMFGGRVGLAPYPLGAHFFGAERVGVMTGWRGGQFPLEIVRRAVAAYGPWVLADTPGGREELRGRLDPRLRELADELTPAEPPPACTLAFRGIYTAAGAGVDVQMSMVRLRDDAGEVVGTALVNKPAVGMSVLAPLTSMWDARHFARMERVVAPHARLQGPRRAVAAKRRRRAGPRCRSADVHAAGRARHRDRQGPARRTGGRGVPDLTSACACSTGCGRTPAAAPWGRGRPATPRPRAPRPAASAAPVASAAPGPGARAARIRPGSPRAVPPARAAGGCPSARG